MVGGGRRTEQAVPDCARHPGWYPCWRLEAKPACVKACPTGAIMFGSKADMTHWAGERIEDLKSRGFANAGLYDPPGVSGTHVMYVLHHADKPALYANLPDKPRISPIASC